VKRERLEWLADNPRYTHRFAIRIGRYCRTATIKDVAEDNHLDWHAVKELDKQYMREQLARIGQPAPRAIGIDEISIGPGHSYRIIVSDLIRRRPIWFGGTDRSEASMDAFYTWLGPKKSGRIRLIVLDMWKAFRASAHKPRHAPGALLIYDKFHVMKHLQEALDMVRKAEYARVSGSDRRFIKG
jgi:transposase